MAAASAAAVARARLDEPGGAGAAACTCRLAVNPRPHATRRAGGCCRLLPDRSSHCRHALPTVLLLQPLLTTVGTSTEWGRGCRLDWLKSHPLGSGDRARSDGGGGGMLWTPRNPAGTHGAFSAGRRRLHHCTTAASHHSGGFSGQRRRITSGPARQGWLAAAPLPLRQTPAGLSFHRRPDRTAHSV